LGFGANLGAIREEESVSTAGNTQLDGVTITLTPAATKEVIKFMEAENVAADVGGLRVSVLPGGCSGVKYSLNIEYHPPAAALRF